LEKNPPLHRRDYGGLQAREHDGTPLAEIYFIGIIDILTTYTTMKSAENFVKSLFVNKVRCRLSTNNWSSHLRTNAARYIFCASG